MPAIIERKKLILDFRLGLPQKSGTCENDIILSKLLSIWWYYVVNVLRLYSNFESQRRKQTKVKQNSMKSKQ